MLDADGEQLVVKIVNPAFDAAELAAQDLAATLLAERTELRVAQPLASQLVETSQGSLHIRLLELISGGTLNGSEYLSPAQVARLGHIAGTVSLALAELEHPGLDRTLQWDLRVAARVVELLAVHLPNDREAQVRAVARSASERVAELATLLPQQAGHFDLTDDNVMRGPDGLPDGVIDFGDVSRGWAVGELAISISSVLHHADAEPFSVLPAIAAFDALRPLSEAEIAALWPLVVLRTAALVVSGEQQIALDADNSYAHSGLEREWRMFDAATSVPSEVMTELIRASLRGVPNREEVPSIQTLVSATQADEFSFDVFSELADEGSWQHAGFAEREAAARASSGPLVRRPGVPQLEHSAVRSHRSPASIPTALTLWGLGGRQAVAPADGRIVRVDDGTLDVVLADGSVLSLTGVTASGQDGQEFAAGAALCTTWQRITARWGKPGVEVSVPDWVRPEYADGWLGLLRDPAPLFGLEPLTRTRPEDAAAALLEAREQHFAEVQEHYFAHPPQIERGWQNHLIAADGRVYLDMVNNVTSIGHGHPGLAAAVSRQLRKLNTNSRFHYSAVAEFAEQLAATLPDPLDTVFLVNSGSEAVDLAIRIAMAATGRQDIVSVLEAYHGWTYASDAVSTSLADNPNALASRPTWVHPVTAPNTFRGPYPEYPERYAADAVAEIRRLAKAGTPAAGFLTESWYGNAGGVQLPDHYLREVYAAVRETGGLALADEVQVGYGRLGTWFWGFEQQGVVPDVVAVAKSMGNGYPLGAVITSRAVAARYREGGYFFSSTGGCPVSCVAGLTVLHEIRDGGLQANAASTGEYLRARLNELGSTHPQIGAVHGHGFYLGLELVQDRASLTPARRETAQLCERLRENGVIMQPTGDHQNVLKIKPPMCASREDVDFFVDRLDHVLATTRWSDFVA